MHADKVDRMAWLLLRDIPLNRLLLIAAAIVFSWPRHGLSQNCVEYYLSKESLERLLPGHTIIGLTKRSEGAWIEYLDDQGGSFFLSPAGNKFSGRWKIENDTICYSYGTQSEFRCKSIAIVDSCELRNGAYLVADRLKREVTGRILEQFEGDPFNLAE